MKVFSGHNDTKGDPCRPELRRIGGHDTAEVTEDIFVQR